MKRKLLITLVAMSSSSFGQITPLINSGNPNFPFPQFKGYTGGAVTLAEKNPVGMPHAELEQRTRDAYTMLCNNMTYSINQNGNRGPLTVNGVKYIMPSEDPTIGHCNCVEGDGYYLLAAAYMADKPTFDGYFMWMHDRQFQKTTRFVDNVVNSPNYQYSPGISGASSMRGSTNVYGGGLQGNSAADGDADLAMALLVAWKQWGDNGLICTDPELGPITYKNEAIKYIKTLTDTVKFAPSLPAVKYNTGIIGLDGYMKNGDSWPEASEWAQAGYQGLFPNSFFSNNNYVDFHAPAYFHAFGKVLQAEGTSPWGVAQYKRAEASSDWIMGQAYKQGYIPWIGTFAIKDTSVTFNNFSPSGADFRYGWRTILNYMWNGAPTITWNPVTHSFVNGTNTYQKDMALRFANFLHHPEAAPFNNPCDMSNISVAYGGTASIKMGYEMNGTNADPIGHNVPMGPGSPSAVVSGNWDLMAQMFRQCVLDWNDSQSNTQNYLTAKPRYFHEWFRLLGMLTLTGNLHDPTQMQPTANLKVYKATNKTFAFYGDTITYTLSYRNYGKLDATSTVLRDTLPQGLTYVPGSATKPIASTNNVLTWNIGTVKGTNANNIAVTKDSVSFKVVVGNTTVKRLTRSASISCSNGSGWSSNEYPNRVTEVMERNYVDILGNKNLDIKKAISRVTVLSGDTFSVKLVVRSGVDAMLDGGRQGVVIAAAHSGLSASQSMLNLKYRIYHGAHEPLINYKNYRISYFLNHTGPYTWNTMSLINEGVTGSVSINRKFVQTDQASYQKLEISFPSSRGAYSPLLFNKMAASQWIHEGELTPFRQSFNVHTSTFANLNFLTDWSAEPSMTIQDFAPYFPIGNDWTDPKNPNAAVNKLHPDQCGTISTVIKKQLVEEWDGYTWRRIYGDAPVVRQPLNNVTTKDTLSAHLSFVGFASGYPQGTVAGKVVSWPKISTLQASDSVVYKYIVRVDNVTNTDDHMRFQSTEVYPNPTDQDFTINVKTDSDYHIYDVKGVALEHGKVQGTARIGTMLKSGVYVLRVDTQSGPEYIKIEKK